MSTDHAKALVHFDKARQALSKARHIDEVVKIRDDAQRMRMALKQAKESPELVNDAVEIKLRAERRAGEMLDQGKRNGDRARREDGGKYRTGSKSAPVPPTLKEIGIPKVTASRWQKIAKIEEPKFEEIIREIRSGPRELSTAAVVKTIAEHDREKVRQLDRVRIATIPALSLMPGERSPAILIDPPYDYSDIGYSERSVSVRPDYAQMHLEEIAALPIPDLALPDSHIYLCAPQGFIFKGEELLDGWGFRCINLLTWKKNEALVGAYLMINSEHILFGVRGSLESKSHDYATAFDADVPSGHSTKPEFIYEMVEGMSPGPWLEIFARVRRPGWKYWSPGAQVTYPRPSRI